MDITLKIRDETFAHDVVEELLVKIQSQRISARELICARVDAEILARKDMPKPVPLVAATQREIAVNEAKTDHQVEAELDQARKRALSGFERNEFFLLVDDQQIDDLDAQIVVSETSKVTFMRITPLKGG